MERRAFLAGLATLGVGAVAVSVMRPAQAVAAGVPSAGRGILDQLDTPASDAEVTVAQDDALTPEMVQYYRRRPFRPRPRMVRVWRRVCRQVRVRGRWRRICQRRPVWVRAW